MRTADVQGPRSGGAIGMHDRSGDAVAFLSGLFATVCGRLRQATDSRQLLTQFGHQVGMGLEQGVFGIGLWPQNTA